MRFCVQRRFRVVMIILQSDSMILIRAAVIFIIAIDSKPFRVQTECAVAITSGVVMTARRKSLVDDNSWRLGWLRVAQRRMACPFNETGPIGQQVTCETAGSRLLRIVTSVTDWIEALRSLVIVMRIKWP